MKAGSGSNRLSYSIMKRYLYLTILALAGLLLGACNPTENPLNDVIHEIEVEGQTNYEVGYEEEIISVKVNANCKWSINKIDLQGNGISWIKTDLASGSGSKEFRIKVLMNNTPEERSGVVNIYSDQVTAYIDIKQAANPDPDAGKEPEPEVFVGYLMPVYQMFESSLGLDVPSGSVVEHECDFTNAKVDGNVIKFNNGLVIEKTGSSPAGIMMTCPTHKNPTSYAGFQLGISANFESGDSWIFKIPMSYEVYGDLRFTYGSRKEGISDASAFKWSSDKGQTWNDVSKMESVASDAVFKSVWFTIPEDKMIPIRGELWIKSTPSAAKVYLQNGIALDYAKAKTTTLSPVDNNTIVISEGFDDTIEANASYLAVPGYMKSATTGYTVSGNDTNPYSSADTFLGFTHCFARPGFLQVGYFDETQPKRCGWNGSVTLNVGARLTEMGITGKTSLQISLNAAGMTNAYGNKSDANVVIKSGDKVVASISELSIDKFEMHKLVIPEVDNNTLLEITSLQCDKASDGTASSAYEAADYRFFIDDLYVEVLDMEQNKDLVLEFDFTSASKMSDWPQTLAASDNPADTFTCPYVIDGMTYNFISAQPTGATGKQWPYFNSDEKALVFPKSRYLGLPSVPGRKLVKVEFTLLASTEAKYVIGTEITSDSEDPGIVKGGEEQSDPEKTEFSFELSETAVNTQYWIRCKSKAPRVTSMTLTYSM